MVLASLACGTHLSVLAVALGGTTAPTAPSHTGNVTAAPAPAETVMRPEHGLARGAWETEPWVLYLLGALVVVGALVYALFRSGAIRVRRRVRAHVPPSHAPTGGRR